MACAQFTRTGRRRKERQIWKLVPFLKGAPCEESIQIFGGAYGKAILHPRFSRLKVERDRATAIGPGSERAVLVRRGRLWLIEYYGDE